MRSIILQPWTTVRGNASASSPVTSITQDVEGWADVGGTQDATFWIDVRNVTQPGGTTAVGMTIQSSPTRDDGCFFAATPTMNVSASTSPVVVKSVRASSTAPLSRYVRWQLSVPGGATGAWDATFRVRMALSKTPYFTPLQLSGCALWLRSDLGIALGSTSVSTWSDQSGNGANAGLGVAPDYNLTGGVNGLPRVSQTAGVTAYLKGAFAASVDAHTLFAVVKYTDTTTNGSSLAGTNSSYTINTAFMQYLELTPHQLTGRVCNTTPSFADATTTDTSSVGSPGIYSTAGDSSNVDLYINGVSKASTSVGFTPGTATNYVIMSLDGTSPQYFLHGDAYEYVLYNRVLTANERILVTRYLGGRYGISVP